MNGAETAILWVLAAIGVVVFFAYFGAYTARRCGGSVLEGIVHGVLLGPVGLVLVALYSRSKETETHEIREPDRTTVSLLDGILAELKWQRQQKEKEIHRAKATQANKP